MPIRLNSTGGGAVTITAPYTASTYTLTAPTVTANIVTDSANSITQSMMSTGLAGTGPAFSAYRDSTNQTITTNTWTKVQFNQKEYDTANCFDNTTNYRFTPNVAGYYQINASLLSQASAITRLIVTTYKNGGGGKYGNDIYPYSTGTCRVVLSALHYMNGTTDYLEVWTYIIGTGTITITAQGGQDSFFQGFLARSA